MQVGLRLGFGQGARLGSPWDSLLTERVSKWCPDVLLQNYFQSPHTLPSLGICGLVREIKLSSCLEDVCSVQGGGFSSFSQHNSTSKTLPVLGSSFIKNKPATGPKVAEQYHSRSDPAEAVWELHCVSLFGCKSIYQPVMHTWKQTKAAAWSESEQGPGTGALRFPS